MFASLVLNAVILAIDVYLVLGLLQKVQVLARREPQVELQHNLDVLFGILERLAPPHWGEAVKLLRFFLFVTLVSPISGVAASSEGNFNNSLSHGRFVLFDALDGIPIDLAYESERLDNSIYWDHTTPIISFDTHNAAYNTVY